MCGIAGVLDPRGTTSPQELASIAERMARTLQRRGPDGSGVWVDERGGLALSHRRLAVVDLSEAGAQPMVSADGRWVLSYNGEIYNTDELASRVAASGVRLRGHSDTELLLESIATFGIRSTLESIDGMWAFALWDRRERRLALVRDRVGEKPLHVGRASSGVVVFASTLDALRQHPEFDSTIDRDALALYFRHKYIPAPHTIFRSVSKVLPGHLVEIDAAGSVGTQESYWNYLDLLGRPPFEGTDMEAAQELDRLLRRSVRRRLVADVPVGAFLSGGIDSSTVVSIAQLEASGPLRTFTIASADDAYDESSEAAGVARHLGTDHTALVVTDADALRVATSLSEVHDEPYGDSSLVPAVLVSELARRDVTVALTGDGADELFGGYTRYLWAPRIWGRIEGVPLRLRRAVARAARDVPVTWLDGAAGVLPRSRRPRQLGLKLGKALDVLDVESPAEMFLRLSSHWSDPSSLVLGGREPTTLHSSPEVWRGLGDFPRAMSAIDMLSYLPDDILAKVDRATMSVSLEGRTPFLDRDIIEFSASLPWNFKVREGRSKWVVRKVLDNYVPPALTERPKAGFGVPIAAWLRGPLKDWAEAQIFDPRLDEYLEVSPRRTAWEEHQQGHNHAYRLWDVAQFSSWLSTRA